MFGVLRRILRALIALPRPLRRLLAGPRASVDGQTLDLDVQLVLRLLGMLAGGEEPSLVEQRRATDKAAGLAWSATPGVTALPLSVPVPAGPGRDAPGRLPARLYTPAEVGDRPAPLLVHFHGGGFALGSIASSEPLCRVLAHQAGVRVLSVEYRLAPENPFPAGLADAAAALDHVLAHRADFNAATVAVGGDSAGANLALTAAHQLARLRDATAAFVLALYPVTDAGRGGGSRELFADGFGLRTVDIEVFERYYLPDGLEPIRPTGLLEVDDLAIMPPCYVATAGFDPLRDEGEELAVALRDAGVPVAARRFPGLVHGYTGMAGVVPAARDAVLDAASALRTGLALTTDRERART
ncbi:alpha/beta hydrolase [Actinomycetospora sp. NBRC 106375]|uniref:alpha/beta hydrolase n=1 Tax=Actinomycetospora sp. NBRC 106375 TaxID=3032207 RepID=UPI0024A36DBF|nr:alpha/beta hydrolase [Actinomycetospora sp. NBRC 106375]GLZ46222.1 alpha/beta hydrolase [Actinomycetospora sp. NBRC 106375]